MARFFFGGSAREFPKRGAAAIVLCTLYATALCAGQEDDDCQQAVDFDRSIAACTRIINNSSAADLGAIYAWRGFAYLNKKDFDSAIRDLGQTIKLDSRNVFALSTRALAYFRKGDRGRARVDYLAAKEIDAQQTAIMFRSKEELKAIASILGNDDSDYDTIRYQVRLCNSTQRGAINVAVAVWERQDQWYTVHGWWQIAHDTCSTALAKTGHPVNLVIHAYAGSFSSPTTEWPGTGEQTPERSRIVPPPTQLCVSPNRMDHRKEFGCSPSEKPVYFFAVNIGDDKEKLNVTTVRFTSEGYTWSCTHGFCFHY